VDFSQLQTLDFIAQQASILQAGEMNLVAPAFFEQAHQLHSLAFSSTLLKAVNDMENSRLQDWRLS